MTRRAVRAAMAAALVGTTLVGAAPAASAAPVTPVQIAACSNGTVGVRETVCAETLSVRTEPGGAWMGTLYRGQTFLVERVSPSGGWVYGFAYGNINRRGWVQNGWFY